MFERIFTVPGDVVVLELEPDPLPDGSQDREGAVQVRQDEIRVIGTGQHPLLGGEGLQGARGDVDRMPGERKSTPRY